MTTRTIGEFKARFSDILEEVRRGAVVGVRYCSGKQPVALLVPPDQAPPVAPRRLGPLQGKASFRLKRGFKMSEAQLPGSWAIRPAAGLAGDTIEPDAHLE